MLILPVRYQVAIGTVLITTVVATRGTHFATLQSLPDASWAAFFLAGIYLSSRWALPGLFAATWVTDVVAYYAGGAGGFCFTPAYLFLLPAYAALWAGGRWYAQRHLLAWRALTPLGTAALVSVTVCELISSGSFYFFSGRFVDTTLAEFGARLTLYFPQSLQAFAFYIVVSAVTHALLGFTQSSNGTLARAKSASGQQKGVDP